MNMARAFLTRRQNTAANCGCQADRKRLRTGTHGTSEAPLTRAGSEQKPLLVFGLGSTPVPSHTGNIAGSWDGRYQLDA